MIRTYHRSERRTTRFDTTSMCRMCLAQNLPAENLVEIFVEEPVTNVSVIEFCTGIECEENDGLPSKMCCDCYNSLTTFFAFKKMCLASEKYCKAFRDAPTISSEHPVIIENVHPKEELTDELSLAENNDMGLLETDCIHPGAPDEVLLQIAKCEEDYELAHPEQNVIRDTSIAVSIPNWEEEGDDEEEGEDEDEEEFLPQFQQQQSLQHHTHTDSSATSEPGAAIGPVRCDVSFEEPSHPVSPAVVETPVQRHSASSPREVLEHPDRLRRFIAVPVKPSHSPKGIPAATSQRPFTRKVDERKWYYCDICSKAFLSQNSLKRHIKSHGSAQYKCPHCEKEFHQRSSMKRHVLLHSDRRFVCSSCSKVLLSREGLKCHIRTQHTERTGPDYYKYKCAHCSKTFAHSSGLSRHMAIHRGISYECDCCSKKFNDSSQLKRHKLKNHPGADSDPLKGVRNTGPVCPESSEPAPTAVA